MKKIKKTLIQKAVIVPLVIGALAAVLFFSMLPAMDIIFPLSEQEIKIADFQQLQQDTAFEKANLPSDGEIKKSDILFSEANSCIGAVAENGKTHPLIYDANDVNLKESLYLLPNGDYIGETGCAYVYGYKSVLDISLFSAGQDIEVVTDYGSYVFTVLEIRTVSAERSIFSMNTGAKRGLVLYTNSDGGYGVCSSFDAVILEMKSGPLVTE